MSRAWCSALPGGVRIAVQITPNAKQTEVTGVFDDALRLKLQAPPIDGKANEALVKFLAATLSLPKSAVTITHGHTNKRKLIEVKCATLTPEAVEALLVGQ